MGENAEREKIKGVAVEHFSRYGYCGSSIREIAKEAGCSLPMIYYYFQSKKGLFHEIIRKDYFDILSRQASVLKINGDILSFYTRFVFGINSLSDRDKKIYRLGIKVFYDFDGDAELVAVLSEWEATLFPRHFALIKPYLSGADSDVYVVRALLRILANLIEAIVVKGKFLPEDEIRNELAVVLK